MTTSKKEGKYLPAENYDEDGATVTCGLGSWRPPWLQFMASPKFFMLNFSIIAVIQGSYFSYLIGCSSTLEKRYGYSGRLTGFVLIADNFSQILISPLIGFLGKRVNKATMIAGGMIFVSFSCWLTALPYYLYGPVSHGYEDDDGPGRGAFGSSLYSSAMNHSDHHSRDFCDSDKKDECPTDGSSLTVWPAYMCIWMASFLNGVGYTAFYTLGFPYVDDNVGKKNAPVYFSVLSALRLLGPTAGFLLVSLCLNMNEDPFTPVTMDRKDPRFVGAWWVGFMVIGAAIFIFALPLFLFPSSLKNKKKIEEVRPKEVKMSKFKEVTTSLMRLFRNPVWMFDTAAGTFRFIGYAGYYITQPKYIESQFRKTAANASLFTGTTSIVAMAIGIISGGVFIRIVRPGPRLLTGLIFGVELFANAGIMSGLFFGCPQSHFVGFDPTTTAISPISNCNMNCGCTQRVLAPVCGSDGRSNYFSPCFAGCTGYNNGSYTGCACDITSGFDGTISKGYCPVPCNNFVKYITFLSLAKLISSTSRTGNYLVRFRSVDEGDKSFAMGIVMTIHGLFGAIPYPLIFGAIADSACLIWEKSCGGTGNCWLYDTEKFRYVLHGSSLLFMTVGSMFDIFVIFYANRMKNLYGEDDEDDGKGDGDGEDGKVKGKRDNGDVNESRFTSINPEAIEGSKEPVQASTNL